MSGLGSMIDWLYWGEFSIRSDDKSECFEGVENGGDLIDALLGLAPETGGERVGVWADSGQQLAQGGHLRGQFRRPIEDDGGGGVRGGGVA